MTDGSSQTPVGDGSLEGPALQQSSSLRESTRPKRASEPQGTLAGSILGHLKRSITYHTPGDGPRRPESSPIFFYERDQPYYEFINYSPYPVEYDGRIYPTAEHLYQAHKFLATHPEIAEQIRNIPSAGAAVQESTKLRNVQREDWFQVNLDVMDLVLEAKFTQHLILREMLVGTGDREIVSASKSDNFWGIGADRRGRNELGKALMRARSKLQAGPPVPLDTAVTDRPALPKPLPPTPGTSSSYTAAKSPREITRRPDRSTFLAAPILFYGPNEPYYEFANTSHRAVWHGQEEYRTAEHLYQAHKFFQSRNPGLSDHIRVQPTPFAAIEAARRLLRCQRSDWSSVRQSSMEATLEAKFSQHADLRNMLLSTGDRQLVYGDPHDAFWGLGSDGYGMNELGKSLMALRDTIRARHLDDSVVGPDIDR
ncbi:NADAR family protein [Phanerochaete sordida]|uniref:NADAR family protein n=1 Tax=Phanerochaete sordida TaxID=48140 RepID=A0A9P3LHW9_9APHY|nr:NADAR family protein [Phanerochaete sordida]